MISINALYVAAEFSTVAVRKARLSQMAASGDRLARLLLPIVEDAKRLDDYIAACQLGITASSLALGAYGQNTIATALAPLLARLGGMADPVAQAVSATGVLIFLTALQVMLGELFPKSVAIQQREQVATAVVVLMKWSVTLFRPFILLFNGSASLILRLIRSQHVGSYSHVLSPAEIEMLVAESHRGGLLDSDEQRMLRNTFRFRELAARQVMTPRIRLIAAPAGSTVAELIQKSVETAATRIPIYRESSDNIIGFVHIKDLFRLHSRGQSGIDGILRPVTHVPEALPIAEVLTTLRSKREYMAIVLDEYGGTAGLITLEDLVEEIVGELQDEFDDEMALISADKDGRLRLRGDLLVADVNEFLGLKLPEDEADTLGGLVMSALGDIPSVGDGVTAGEPPVEIRVETMEARGVAEVSLKLPQGMPLHAERWEADEPE